ncbi:energy-coupling factor transporter transmembrane component T family protein [Caldithrix abyssi]
MELILQQTQNDHWMVRLNSLGKMLSAIILIAGILALPFRSSFHLFWLTAWTFALIAVALSINFKLIKYFSRSAVMFLLLTIALPFHPAYAQEAAWIKIDGITLYQSGVQQLAATFLKAMQILAVSLIVVVTTPYTRLLKSLQRFKIPDWVLAILMYMFRLIFLMEQEMARMKRAMNARSAKIGLKRKLQILIAFTGVYLARLMDRSERGYQAMIARGFRGKIEFWDEESWGVKDGILLAISATFFLGVVLWR